jgi:hypothetical protein
MRVPDEEVEHRLALVDLVLDIEGPMLICKKCGYVFTPAGNQIIIYLLGKYQIILEFQNGLIKLI